MAINISTIRPKSFQGPGGGGWASVFSFLILQMKRHDGQAGMSVQCQQQTCGPYSITSSAIRWSHLPDKSKLRASSRRGDEDADRRAERIAHKHRAGTPCGDLMRRYWHPIAAVSELDGLKWNKRVRLLGEDLVLYRDKQGHYGLITESARTGALRSRSAFQPTTASAAPTTAGHSTTPGSVSNSRTSRRRASSAAR